MPTHRERDFRIAVRTMLKYIGEDPLRQGLDETPERVLKAWKEMFSGYTVDVKSLFTVFDNEEYSGMVVSAWVPFVSFCEHHLLPFTGIGHIAYIPGDKKKVIGLSKLARILDAFSKRLQVQERMTEQVTACLDQYLEPEGSACILVGEHSCMSCRGVKKTGSKMITSSLTKEFRKPEVRAELFSLIQLAGAK